MTVNTDNFKSNRRLLYVFVCIGNLVAFSCGIMLGWPSPVIVKLKDQDKIDENPLGEIITDEQDSWIISVLPLGSLVGSFVSNFLSDTVGRKRTLIFCAGVPMLVCYMTLAFARHIILFYAARILAGFAYGVYMALLPNFNSEIAEDSIRGMITSSMNVFEISGPLYAYVVGPYTSIKWFNISCALWPTLFIILFFLFVPESPYYLVAIGDCEKAKESLRKFRQASDSHIEKEFETIKRSVMESMKRKNSFFDIFKSKSLSRALFISLSLIALQQLSGIVVVLTNVQRIFEAAGSNFSSEISAIVVGVVQTIASFTTPLLVDRLGRKSLLLTSAIGMILSEVPLGVYFYLQETDTNVSSISWLPMFCLMVYIFLYNYGFGVLPWVVMAEIFPEDVKSSASTATASMCWVVGFLQTKFFNSVHGAIGMSGAFWLFSGFCGISIPFVIFCLFETKEKSFQEIQTILAK